MKSKSIAGALLLLLALGGIALWQRSPARDGVVASSVAPLGLAAAQIEEGSGSFADAEARVARIPAAVEVGLRVIVLERRTALPVAGARVHDAVRGGLLAVSGDRGVVAFTARALGEREGAGASILVRAERFAPQTVELDGAREIVVHLERGWRATGRVVTSLDEQPVPEGFSVLARAADSPDLSPEEARAIAAGHPRLHLCVTEPDGSFEIDGLAPGRSYRLLAGGLPGWLTAPRDAPEVGEERPDAVVPVRRVAGIHVRLVSVDGTPFQGPSQRNSLLNEGIRLESNAGLIVLGRWEALALTTMGAQWSGYAADRRTLVALSSGGELPMAHVRVAIPGYLPAEASFPLEHMDGRLAERELLLTPTSSGWGEVVLALADASPPFDASLELRLQSAARASVERYASSARSSYTVTGVPYGEYSAMVFSTTSSLVLARDPAVVVGPQPYVLPVSLAGSASLELSVEGPGGPYAGELRLVLVEGDGSADESSAEFSGRGKSLTLAGPPYRIDALKPDTLSLISLHFPLGTSLRASFFELRPGEVEHLSFRLE